MWDCDNDVGLRVNSLIFMITSELMHASTQQHACMHACQFMHAARSSGHACRCRFVHACWHQLLLMRACVRRA
jgi:hypothetical protein